MMTVKKLNIFSLKAIFSLLFLIAFSSANAQKSDLKILYAGSPKTKRTKEFKAFLSTYFETVATTAYEGFKPEESTDFDVVIFDWKPIVGDYAPPLELPKTFTKPSITIGSVGPSIGEFFKSKIDPLCLCMDYGAQNIITEHPIFNTPNKINLTYETAPTPPDFKHHYLGKDLGETIQVWRVQTKGFDVLEPGMVSTGHGFNDSPDAEFISGGMCMKGPESVAIGRQGNFFQWGFIAQPKDLTEEAKLTFINAIHYIKKFDGHTPILQTVEGAQSREYALENAYYLSVVDDIFNEELAEFNRIETLIKSGKKVTKEERELLEFKEYSPKSADALIEESLPDMFTKEQIKRFGKDSDKYMAYFKENLEYLYTVNFFFHVDEDAKKLGIPNRSVKLLEYAINALEKNENTKVANRMLTQYTNETFETAKEWRTWFDTNKAKLFFSDVGGYKFMVSTVGE